MAAPVITPERIDAPSPVVDPELPWVAIVWNDPVNLMSYVQRVFEKLFGYPRDKAHKLMMQVHEEGRAAVATGSREQVEAHVAALHAHGLWATLQQD